MRSFSILLIVALFMSSCQNESSETATNAEIEPQASAENPYPNLKLPESRDDKEFDWQAHRGGRGLLPENTFQAFLLAIREGVTTLEMDLVISKDSQVVVSHEPWISSKICLDYNGKEIPEDKELEMNIFQMNYGMVKACDCGSKGNPDFPEQKKMKSSKPLLKNIFEVSKAYTSQNNKALPYFNLEIKSKPDWVGVYVPDNETFVKLVLEVVNNSGVKEAVNIQSFDAGILKEVKKQDPNMPVSLLVDNANGLESNLASLGFTPEFYSPHYLLCTNEMVTSAHDKGMKVIPWTVNDQETMKQLKDMGVDGIITDYPNKKI
ncbi:MAG: glycerophosphodiester phosphodiesterase family protein [Saprospiraceae bacterium]